MTTEATNPPERERSLARSASPAQRGQPSGWGGGSLDSRLQSAPDPGLAIDRIQVWIGAALQPVELPLSHTFTPGLYTRRIFMPKGACIVSKIHRTKHPFVILTGAVRVWDAMNGTQDLSAPHFGITQPGTRRVLYILEDCIWATFHAGPWTTPEAAEADLIEPHVVPAAVTAEVLAALSKGSVSGSVGEPVSGTSLGESLLTHRPTDSPTHGPAVPPKGTKI